jgi:hypothetical protein
MKHRVLTLRPGGALERTELDYDGLSAFIGNTFTSFFNVDQITGFCDDEYLLRDTVKWCCVPQPGTLRRDAHPIGGNIVISAYVPATGETRDMTDEEMDRFLLVEPSIGWPINGVWMPLLAYLPPEGDNDSDDDDGEW